MRLLDIHSHFLYGLDDGSPTIEAMDAMLDAAVRDGIGRLYATPHVVPGCKPFDMEQYEKSFAEAERYCREKGYDLQLVPGAEILYTPAMDPYVRRNELITMGSTNMVLIEFSPSIAYADIDHAVGLAEENGYQVIMAHIERYQCLTGLGAVEKLRKKHPDVLLQVNARSVAENKVSFVVRQCIQHWLKKQMIDFIASDAHRIPERPYMQKAAYEALSGRYDQAYVDFMMTVSEE